jgi:drug/metabolite transporter (DMT)-like permease
VRWTGLRPRDALSDAAHQPGGWMASPPLWLRLAALTAVVLASASCFTALKAALVHAPPMQLVALRLSLGGAALLAVLPPMGIPVVPRRHLWPWIIMLGVAVTAFSYGTMALSLGFTGAGIASVLGNIQPLLAVALGAWLLGERVTRAESLALVIGLVGVLLVAFPATSGVALGGGIGPLLALASSVGLVAASVVVKHVGPDVSRLVLAAWPLVLGSIPLFLVSLALEPGDEIAWSLPFLGLLLFLALPGTALLTLVWYWLLRHGDLGRLSLFFYAVPVAGLGLSWLFYAEPITPRELLGVTVILLAIIPIAAAEWRRSAGS